MYKRIKQLRVQAGLLQKDVIAVLNCSQQVYSDYENGRVDIPTAILISLAKLYGTTSDYILGLCDDPATPCSPKDVQLLSRRFDALGHREQAALMKLSEFFIEVMNPDQGE